MFGNHERCSKDTRKVSLLAIHGVDRLPHVNMFVRMCWMSSIVPVRYTDASTKPIIHRKYFKCTWTRESALLMHSFSSERIPGAICFCSSRKKHFRSLHTTRVFSRLRQAPGNYMRLPCNRASRSANTSLISCCPSILDKTPLSS